MPKRIQRKRSKGWRMPENAVYVGRPTMFGNPFEVRRFGLDAALQLYSNSVTGLWTPSAVPAGRSVHVAYQCHRELLEQFRRAGFRDMQYAITRLRGKDLACWCPLDQRCHADVLLELANGAGDRNQPRRGLRGDPVAPRTVNDDSATEVLSDVAHTDVGPPQEEP